MNRLLLFSTLLLTASWGCQNESKETDYSEDILGRWEITQALRDGQETQTLDNGFMEFLPEGKMVSNLAGAREELNYQVEGKEIAQKGGRLDLNYTIESLADSTLVLSLQQGTSNFRFTLMRRALDSESGN